MPCLVRGNADGRHRRGRVHRTRQPNDVASRVKMVGQLAGNVLDPHTGNAVVPQDSLRRLCAGQSPQILHPRVAVKRAVYLVLRPECK